MKPQQLKTFVAISETGGIRSAARRMFVSQSAVARTLRELEADLEVPLVRRNGQSIELTDYGHAFTVRARLMLEEAERARDELRQMKRGEAARVRIAVSSLPSMLLLPSAIVAFRCRHPLVALECHETVVASALPALREGRFDFVLTQDRGDPPGPDFVAEPLLRAPLAIGARVGHPKARARSLQSLQGEEWIAWSHEMAAVPFRAAGLPPPARVLIGQSLALARNLVERSDLVGLFARAAIERRQTGGTIAIVPVREPLPEAVVSLVTRRGTTLTPAATALVESIRGAIPAGRSM